MKDYLKTIAPWLLWALLTCLDARGANRSFSWEPSPDTNVLGYRLYILTNAPDATRHIAATFSTAGTNWVWTNALAGIQCYAFVTSTNSAGFESDPSNEITFETPLPPSNLRVNVKLQTASTVNGPWENYADLGTFDVVPETPFYRAFLTIQR